VREKVVLVVEDGLEYTNAFAQLWNDPSRPAEFVRAGDADEARRILSDRRVDAVFLDMVFDRTPPDRLAGDVSALIARFGGDRAGALEYLARNEGFYVADELSSLIPPDAPVILAYDFSADPERLTALREKLPTLDGLPEGAAISELLGRLLE
jgi:hypothetical protein